MKKFRYIITVSTVDLAVGNHAYAADIFSAPENPASAAAAPAFSWQGFYAGDQIGGSWNELKNDGKKSGRDGFIGGLYAGYTPLRSATILFWGLKQISSGMMCPKI